MAGSSSIRKPAMTPPIDAPLEQRHQQIFRAIAAALWAMHLDGLLGTDDLRRLYAAAFDLCPTDAPAARRVLRQIIRSEARLASSRLDLVRHRWATELAGDEDRQVAVFVLNRMCGHRGALERPSSRLNEAVRALSEGVLPSLAS